MELSLSSTSSAWFEPSTGVIAQFAVEESKAKLDRSVIENDRALMVNLNIEICAVVPKQ